MPVVNYTRIVRELENVIYDFEQNHPEHELNRYGNILKANGIEWGMDSMSDKDVSELDGKCVMAMLMGAVRAERFCDGALLGFFKKGCIKKWLERLKEIDESGSVCACRESEYLFVMRDYLVKHGMKYDGTIDDNVTARKNGKTYDFSEHLQAMVYSLLSAQRPWAKIVRHLDEIDGIFFGYDAKKILKQTDTYFVDRIREIKCGNRNIHVQMKYLPDNIATLRSIEKVGNGTTEDQTTPVKVLGNLTSIATNSPNSSVQPPDNTGATAIDNSEIAIQTKDYDTLIGGELEGAKAEVEGIGI